MKIAFLNIYQGLVERGAERVVEELAERLKKNHSVKIFVGDKLPPKRWPIVWRAFIDPQGIAIFWWTLKLLPKIVKERFDVVIPTNSGWQPAVIRLITWVYGGKMVIIGHSGAGWDEKNNLWAFPDIFVAPSTTANKWAKSINPFVRRTYIPNGVELVNFRPDGPKVKDLGLEKPIILCVGALEPEKRLDLAIDAVSGLEKGSLLIIGRGQLKKELTEKGRELLGDRFEVREASFSEIPNYYRSADVFTAPSAPWQSFELVILEALASNLPVVGNNDEIRKEIVESAGILVDSADTIAYSNALRKALAIKWGSKPRNQAGKFSWDLIAFKYKKLFETLLNE